MCVKTLAWVVGMQGFQAMIVKQKLCLTGSDVESLVHFCGLRLALDVGPLAAA